MIIKRYEKNPILKPNLLQSWEAEAVFNGSPIEKGKKIYFLYRAMSLPHYHTLVKGKVKISDIGIAESEDGIHFYNRRRFIVPDEPWDKFGCEDPRVSKVGGKYFIFYTALSEHPVRAEGIKVGVAVSKDLVSIQEKHLVTPFNAKAMTLFSEKINGKIWGILTVHTDKPPARICLVSFEKEEDIWSESLWLKWYQHFEKFSLPLQRRSQDHIEVGASPLKTKKGWLLFYAYIQNYFLGNPLFGIEAVLLDLKNPLQIVATTKGPILVPEEFYERIGLVPNVVFPSGALLKNNLVYLYYGAADTTCCLAFIELSSFLEQFFITKKTFIKFERVEENPVITPIKNHSWESKATFNPAAIFLEGKVHLIYRAMSEDNTSVFGYATSRDGIHIDYRSSEPIYLPREPFEQKLIPNGNSGVEDPRLTKIGEKLYMTYTAFDGKNPPRVALTSISVKDFLAKKWNWAKAVLISPPDFDNKDACIFPEKIKGLYFIIHRVGDDIDLAYSQNLDFDGKTWLEEYRWIMPRKGWWDSKKVGAAAPPIKTEDGWVFLYHGVSEDSIYRVGALLLDLNDPLKVLGRTIEPLFEPETPYEKEGQVSNVVFPCGAVVIGENLFIYYGGADQVVGIASMKMRELVDILKTCKC